MIIIYHCYGSAHSSVLAAAIHTKMLPENRIPANHEIKNLPHYDKTDSKLIGTPFYFGSDENNNKIFILGMGTAKKIVKNVIYDLMKVENIPEKEVLLINTLKNINLYVRIGGFLSRKLGLIYPGRFLTIYGLKQSYNKFVDTVREVKNKIGIA